MNTLIKILLCGLFGTIGLMGLLMSFCGGLYTLSAFFDEPGQTGESILTGLALPLGAEFTWIYAKTFGSMRALQSELDAKAGVSAPGLESGAERRLIRQNEPRPGLHTLARKIQEPGIDDGPDRD